MRAVAALLALAVLVALHLAAAPRAGAQDAAARGESFADRLRGAGIAGGGADGEAARRGADLSAGFADPGPTPIEPTPTPPPQETPPPPTATPEPTPTPEPSCTDLFGAACDPGRGIEACCVPGYEDSPLPCISNDSSGGVAICTDVIGAPQCQPQIGLPCQVGGYEGCCDPTLACVNSRCQAP